MPSTRAQVQGPVYLRFRANGAGRHFDSASFDEVELQVNESAVTEAAGEIVDRLSRAERPVLIVGVEVHRFQLIDRVIRLAGRMRIPVTSSFLGRGIFPTRHPQFIGTYLGAVSPVPMRTLVGGSDCLLCSASGSATPSWRVGRPAARARSDDMPRAGRVHRASPLRAPLARAARRSACRRSVLPVARDPSRRLEQTYPRKCSPVQAG